MQFACADASAGEPVGCNADTVAGRLSDAVLALGIVRIARQWHSGDPWLAMAPGARLPACSTLCLEPVTGLPDVRVFAVLLDRKLVLARRALQPLSVVFFEVDGFSQLSSTQARVAQRLAARLVRGTLRESDSVCHCTDGILAAILDDTPHGGAVWAADRVRREVAARSYHTGITLSMGVASYPTHALEVADLREPRVRGLVRRPVARSIPTRSGRGAAPVTQDSHRRVEQQRERMLQPVSDRDLSLRRRRIVHLDAPARAHITAPLAHPRPSPPRHRCLDRNLVQQKMAPLNQQHDQPNGLPN